ncbi:hypothetical protein VCHA43P273_20261 [Vibrio chagasii]|nr:hypothetical protein VCHA43P273_20261 [Vibrio chagasii]CAH7417375.1 hypothetical protein VCHA57P527_20231 [Vibrio chagasii]
MSSIVVIHIQDMWLLTTAPIKKSSEELFSSSWYIQVVDYLL